jgi:hypothetical protein
VCACNLFHVRLVRAPSLRVPTRKRRAVAYICETMYSFTSSLRKHEYVKILVGNVHPAGVRHLSSPAIGLDNEQGR